MNSPEAFDIWCVIGKELHGRSVCHPRPETNAVSDILLGDHNSFWTVLKDGANCTISRSCDKNEEFSKIKQRIFSIGLRTKLHEDEGDIINGNRILCEHENEIKLYRDRNKYLCIMKGNYAIGRVTRPITSGSRFLFAGERIQPGRFWECAKPVQIKVK